VSNALAPCAYCGNYHNYSYEMCRDSHKAAPAAFAPEPHSLQFPEGIRRGREALEAQIRGRARDVALYLRTHPVHENGLLYQDMAEAIVTLLLSPKDGE